MNVLTSSWRCSFVATALCAVLGNSPAPATAADNPAPPPAAADREKAQEQFRAIRERAAQLDQQGKHDDAERMRREGYEALKKTLGAATSSEYATAPSPERQKLYDQYKALHEKIEAAKQAGKQDDIRRLTQEMDALRGKLRCQEPSTTARNATSGGDRAARLQHLRAAAENLKAAGFDGEAQHVIEMARHFESEGQGVSTRTSSATRPASAGDSVSPAAIAELRTQVEQMHREMREMRELLTRGKNSERQ